MRTAQLALSVAKGEPHGWGESSNRRYGDFQLGRKFEKSILNQPLAALASSGQVISLISQRSSVRHAALTRLDFTVRPGLRLEAAGEYLIPEQAHNIVRRTADDEPSANRIVRDHHAGAPAWRRANHAISWLDCSCQGKRAVCQCHGASTAIPRGTEHDVITVAQSRDISEGLASDKVTGVAAD